MAGLTGKNISNAYKSILRVDDDVNGIDSTLETITDGSGNASPIRMSDDVVNIVPNNDDTTGAFKVSNKSASAILTVDSTNNLVKVGASQVNATTQYAHFHINGTWWASASANNHYPMAFNSSNLAGLPTFGTSTEPATTFTTAEGSNTRAADLVPMLWYLPEAISIDSVTSIEGADTATGDTTRMHLYSYTFTSGSTSALSSGTLIASNSDVTNAGSEQAYRSSWTVTNPDVAQAKVILAFMRADSVNSDYSASVYIKYHIQ